MFTDCLQFNGSYTYKKASWDVGKRWIADEICHQVQTQHITNPSALASAVLVYTI